MLRPLWLTLLFALSLTAARPAEARPQEPEAPAAADGSSADTGAAVETAEAPAAPRLTTEADWGQWERLGADVLSPDGRWIMSISRTTQFWDASTGEEA